MRFILIDSCSESWGRWVADLPPRKWQFDSYWYIPTLRVQADQVADLPLPPRKWWFEIHTDRFLLWELRQIKWQMYPPENGDLRFILIDSYSDSSGRPGGRSSCRPTSPRKWQFEIHTDRFLLWELRQIKWQIYPPENGNLWFILIDSYSWELRQTRRQIYPYPPENGDLRFIWRDSYSESWGRSSCRSITQKMVIWDSYW